MKLLRGLYAACAGLNVQQARMEVVTNNLANAGTAGYKRETAVLSPFYEMMLVNLRGETGPREIGVYHHGARVSEVVTDLSPGTLVQTGHRGDLALDGEGFFCLEGEDGNPVYTRGGRFHVDAAGYLVHTSGLPLLGEGGPVQVGGEDFTVSAAGEVTSASGDSTRLAIYDFADPSLLQQSGNNLFTAPGAAGAEQVENPRVYQGYIEESNTDPVQEMVTAVEVVRAYQAGQKMAQAHDRLLELAVREVGKVKS